MEVKLIVVGGKQEGMEIPVQGPEFLIGRGEECRLRPQSTLISRKHCAILVDKDSAVLVDFGSVNGTLVNGERVQDRCELKNGDRIKIGIIELAHRSQPHRQEKAQGQQRSRGRRPNRRRRRRG